MEGQGSSKTKKLQFFIYSIGGIVMAVFLLFKNVKYLQANAIVCERFLEQITLIQKTSVF